MSIWHTQAWEWIDEYACDAGFSCTSAPVIIFQKSEADFVDLLIAFQRKTRSGRSFSAWDGSHVSPATDTFDLSTLLREAIAEDDRRNELLEGNVRVDIDDLGFVSDHACSPPATLAESLPAGPGPGPSPVTACSVPPTVTGQARRIARKKAQGKKNRKQDRIESNAAVFSHHDARPKTLKKYVSGKNAVETLACMEDAKVARTAYIGLNDKETRDAHNYTLEELVGEGSKFGFTLLKYRKGMPIPIVSNDEEKYVIGVMADAPDDDSWPSLIATAAELLEDARLHCDVDEKDRDHRRGQFDTLRCGVSHGGGQTMPGNLCNKPVNAAIAQALNESEPFMRIAKFTTAVMATWAPKLYHYYVDRLGTLHAEYPSLCRNFSSSVFEATTYNLGPRTACFRHRDFGNLPFGWCAVTALGEFDYTKGGHLVLWEAHLVIEFPSGTTILLPSAIISHSNVAISSNERRYSFTQYSAGGLFRWVDNKFQRAADYKAKLKGKALTAYLAEEKGRWSFGLGLLSRLEDLDSASKLPK